MKSQVAALFVVVGLALPAAASEPVSQEMLTGDLYGSRAEECRPGALTSADPTILAQQGCCSWHGGVCGCNWGRVVCCDGRLSPTCLCRGDSEPPVARVGSGE